MKRCPFCNREVSDERVFCTFDGHVLDDVAKPDEWIGQVLDDRYRIEEWLGVGETGKVYRATLLGLDATVALKIVHPDLLSDEAAVERFRRHARAIAMIRHPNVVAVTDFGFIESTRIAYLVMEFLEGKTLRKRLNEEKQLFPNLPERETLQIVRQICSALHAAHLKGLIHHNLRPERIWLLGSDGASWDVKVAFGVSSLLAGPESPPVREPHYASPEECRNEELDARSNVYSLGIIIYEMLTGLSPFSGPSASSIAVKQIFEPPTPLREIRPGIPEQVAHVVLRSLSKSRENRQGSALQLALEFEGAMRADDLLSIPLSDPLSGLGRTMAILSVAPFEATPDQKPPLYLDDNVQFTVYRPNTIRPQKWYTLPAFAHLSERQPDAPEDEPDPIEEVQRQARLALGEQASEYQNMKQESRLAVPREGELTFVPEIPGIEFNPAYRSFKWQETVHREDFRFRASKSVDGRTVKGRFSIFLGSILLAEIVLSIKVDGSYIVKSKAPLQERDQARPFRKIFASYSHKDLSIVGQFERIARASGDEFMRDWTHLRVGEVWSDRLCEMIREANSFQLFWSTNSMRSRFVKQEWEYALSLDRRDFIRPLYWEAPMPVSAEEDLPPDALKRLHFFSLAFAPRAEQLEDETASSEEKTWPPEREGRTICLWCGMANSAGERFCMNCRNPIRDRPDSEPSFPTQPRYANAQPAPPPPNPTQARSESERAGRPRSAVPKAMGTIMAIVILSAVGLVYYQQISSSKDIGSDPPIWPASPQNSPAPINPLALYEESIVLVEARSHLVYSSTGAPAYQRYVLNSYNGKPIIADGRRTVPAYLQNSEGKIEPYVVANPRLGLPLEEKSATTGVIVTNDGFIVTTERAAGESAVAYSFPGDARLGVLVRGSEILAPAGQPSIVQAPKDWIPDKRYELRRDSIDVTFQLGGAKVPGKLAKLSNRSGAAFIKVDVPEALAKVELYDFGQDEIKPGLSVTVVSAPLRSELRPVVNQTSIAQILRAGYHSFGPTDIYQLNALTAKGGVIDGSPVFDDSGRVIGIVSVRESPQGDPLVFVIPSRP